MKEIPGLAGSGPLGTALLDLRLDSRRGSSC